MDYKIVLSERAIKDLNKTIVFLLKRWTEKEASSFLDKLDEIKNAISKNPLLFPYHDEVNQIHKAVLTKHNIIFYKIDDTNKIIQIITIFNVYQDPEKLGL